MIFDFETFFNWYKTNKNIYTYGYNIRLGWYQKNDNNEYEEYFENVNKELNIIDTAKIYVKVISHPVSKIFFIRPEKGMRNGIPVIWGTHYTFVRDDENMIKFHKTIEREISSNGTKSYKNCFFPDKQVIPKINKITYSLDSIICRDSKKEKCFLDEFEDDEERELIKQIMIAPFIYPIPNDLDSIKNTLPLLGGSKKILDPCIRNFLNKCNNMYVVIVKDKTTWHYTLTLNKNDKLLTIYFSSIEVEGNSHSKRIQNFIKRISYKN